MTRKAVYCIALLVFTLFAQPSNRLSANIVNAGNAKGLKSTPTTGDDNTIPLSANVAQQGSIPAPSAGDCSLSPLQYSFSVPGEGTCDLPFPAVGFWVTGDQNLKLYIRYGQRVEVEGDRIIADYVSEAASQNGGIDISAWSTPPLQGGTYFIAIGNCGPDQVSYEIYVTPAIIDFAGPVIFRAEVVGEKLLVYGLFDGNGGELFLNGKRQKEVMPDEHDPGCILIANKAGKKIGPGERVTLRVKYPNGYGTPKFKFTRPPQ